MTGALQIFVRVTLPSAAALDECTERVGTTKDEGHVGGQCLRHVHSRRAACNRRFQRKAQRHMLGLVTDLMLLV